jgi:hypothetical protein
MIVLVSKAVIPWLNRNGSIFSVAADKDWAKPHSRDIAVLRNVQAE